MSLPSVLSFVTASVYEMRGNGGRTASSGLTSRSSSASSDFRRSRQRATIEETNSSCSRMLASESFHATSGSTIQTSVRWRRVVDFSARRARVRPYGAGDLHRCLLRKPAEPVPRRLRYVLLRQHDLQGSGAVAQHHEADLARRARGHHPTARDHRLTRQGRQLLDTMEVGHRGGRLAVKRGTRKWERGTEMPVPTSAFHVPRSCHPTLNNSNPRS